MERQVVITLNLPGDCDLLEFPKGLNDRLHFLLDKQNEEGPLTGAELLEAEGLVDVANAISILRMKADLAGREASRRDVAFERSVESVDRCP